MKRALFLIFHGFDPANGISKKISYQVDALRACGLEVHLCHMDESVTKRRVIDGTVVADYGNGTWSKILKRTDFSAVLKFTKEHAIEFVYIRSNHNANPFTIRMVRQMKRQGIRVVMEIPTYPYDPEYEAQGMQKQIAIDKLFRRRLARQLDAIVTFSDYDRIFGQQTIRISNGIDFDSIHLKTTINDTTKELNLIGVAEIHKWHGFDRVVKGLANYYARPRSYTVRFHVVGYFFSAQGEAEFRQLVTENKMDEYVVLHGKRHGEELDELFETCDFGIGSLGRHRVGIQVIKTLKNREYAARGIPFLYSETDSDFDHKPYVLKVPADESAIDMDEVVSFYRALSMPAAAIRDSIQDLSWKNQMEHVINEVSK